MANRNTVGFGLIAQGNVGATDAAGGQGKYFIDSNYAVAMFQGSVVQSKAGYIADAEAARTRLTIGILNGIFYNDATTNKPTFQNHYVANTVPANSEDITAFVIDNPLQLFAVGVDGAVTAASYGLTMSMTQAVPAGSTSSGQSSKQLNVAANCLDRHLPEHGDEIAIIWEGEPGDKRTLTYSQLLEEVCRMANVLIAKGVKAEDRVLIYMPMVPEAAVAMLACTRIGAVHSVVFGGFSPDALKDRILDSECTAVITADEGLRGARAVPLKANTDKALENCPSVHTVFVVKRTGGQIDWHDGRDVWYHEATAGASADCEPEAMSAEDPLFILYTSGSTGKPKGVKINQKGFLETAELYL